MNRAVSLCLLAALLVSGLPALAGKPQQSGTPKHSILRYDTIHRPLVGEGGMVVSQRAIASEVGAQILRQGGNAIDAAVGVGFALAVVLPRAGNIGGGGFMLLHLADTQRTFTIDYRETAPLAANEDVFIDGESGDVDHQAQRASHRSVAVPGTVAGLHHALSKYGTMSLDEVLKPAILLARDGFLMDYDTSSAIATRKAMLSRWKSTEALFFGSNGKAVEPGELFVQPELANTLQKIAEQGIDAFYRGAIARLIVDEMQRHDGLITLQDLASYRVFEREAVTGSYRGYKIASMPPPSSGGIHLIQMLNVLENFPIKKMGLQSAKTMHLLAATMKRAYADRSKHLGDPGFYPVPQAWLTSKEYGNQLAQQIKLASVVPSSEIYPGQAPAEESIDTTHYSVVDQWGNAVSNTYTLNFSFGSGILVPGGGFLLNNEMADFSAKAGVPYAFGLLGGEANSVQPGKRPLSAMTPTMVFKEGKPMLVTGSPGGSRIISTVLQQIINVVDHDLNIAEATHAGRIHHQWFPDQIEVEASVNADSLRILESMGYKVVPSGTMGSLQSIVWRDGRYYGTADPRRPGAGAVGLR